MNEFIKFALTIALFSGSYLAQAQSLDLQTCLVRADSANRTIRASRLKVAMTDEQVQGFLSARLPKLTFNADYRYNAIIQSQLIPAEAFGGAPGTYNKVQFGVPFNLNNTLQLTQAVYNPQTNQALNSLKISQKISSIQEEMTVQDVKFQVATTFFNLQAVNKQYDFVAGNIINMDKLILSMEAMVNQKMVISTELDKLNISRLNLINNRESLKATKERLEMVLNILIGAEPTSPVQLVTDELVEKSILVDEKAANFPALELLDAQKELNTEERKGTKLAYLPSLNFYASYVYNYNINPETDFRTGINGAFLGLQLNWTLFDGFEKKYKLKVNALSTEKIEAEQEILQQQLNAQTINAKKQIQLKISTLNVVKEQLNLSQRVYDQTASQFREGAVSSNDLITADNNLQQAQTNVIATYIELRQVELEYLKTMGNIK